MEDTINNDLIARDFKKHPVIARPHPVFREVVGESLHIAAEIVFQPSQPLDHSTSVCRKETFEVLFGLRFELNFVFHGVGKGKSGGGGEGFFEGKRTRHGNPGG